jgi:uncharacterized membrane protein
VAGIIAGLTVPAMVVAAQVINGHAVNTDEWTSILLSAGFPAWAVVVLYVGRALISEISGASERLRNEVNLVGQQLQQHILETERRLAKLEADER